MKAQILTALIGVLFKILTPELLTKFVDTMLDWIEDYVIGSASTVDDRLVLPICALVRKTFDVPDDD